MLSEWGETIVMDRENNSSSMLKYKKTLKVQFTLNIFMPLIDMRNHCLVDMLKYCHPVCMDKYEVTYIYHSLHP